MSVRKPSSAYESKNPHTKDMKIHQQRVLAAIQELGSQGIEHKKLLAWAAWDLGVRGETVNKYLDTMQTLGKIRWDNSRKVWVAVVSASKDGEDG